MITHIGEQTLEEVIASGMTILPTTYVKWPVGEFIYRARYHDSDRIPQTVGEIYYPPKERCVLGRANHFEEQVFYGMLPTGNAHARLACYHEVASRIQPIQTFTLSRWRVKRELDKVLSLVMHPNQAQGHELARRSYAHTMEFLKELPDHLQPAALNALNTAGARFSRNIDDCDYWWSVRFANNVFYVQDFNAIIYPSIPYKHQAICIAMPGIIADECLEPVGGSLFQLHQMDGAMREFSYQNFSVEGERLIWTMDKTPQPGFREYARSTVPRDCSPCEKQRDMFLRSSLARQS